jgi:probable addiction module antidote protein
MSLALIEFDPADYLTNGESIAAYLTEAFENEDARGVVDALGDVVRARGGIDQVAKDASLPHAVVSSALDQSAPDFDAVLKVIHGLGVRLSASLVA